MLPFARNTISRTTSPSILRLRPLRGCTPDVVFLICQQASWPLRRLGAFFWALQVQPPSDPRSPWTAVRRAWRWWRIRRAVAKAGARLTVPRIPLAPPVPLPYPGPPGKRGRTKTINIRGFVRVTLTRDSVGIPETARLYFVHRSYDCRGEPALPEDITTRLSRHLLAALVGSLAYRFSTGSKTGLSSTGFASKVLALGGSTFAARKTCVCLGFSYFTGSGPPPALVPAV